MNIAVKKYWPLIVALCFLWSAIAVLFALALKNNDGTFTYALDDPYIHMAIAKNFSQHGVWGVTSEAFTSTTSSPLWTFLLALIYLFTGVNSLTPLILNIIFATMAVLVTYVLLQMNKVNTSLTAAVLLGVVFLTPLPTLVFTGMEHTLQILIMIPYLYLAAVLIAAENHETGSRVLKWLLLLTPLLVLIRFESLFLVAAICLLLLWRRRWHYSLYFMLAALVPHVIYTAISMAKGWFWLPSSLILKSQFPGLSTPRLVTRWLLFRIAEQLLDNPWILLLLLVALLLFVLRFDTARGIWDKGQVMIVLYVLTAILHLQFANTGWFFRYEAYLIALGLAVIALTAREFSLGPMLLNNSVKHINLKWPSFLVLIILLLVPFVQRTSDAFTQTPRAMTSVYEQMYQMGLFLERYYHGKVVVVNDIGAINYLADTRSIDVFGLGSKDVASLIKENNFNRRQIEDYFLTKDVKIAVLNNLWYQEDKVPSGWIEVGSWEDEDTAFGKYKLAIFYAVDPAEQDELIKNLREFAPELPDNVIQRGKYLSNE